MKYIISFDLSLNSSGYSIFTDKYKFVENGTIDTNDEKELQLKLKIIGDRIKDIREQYYITYVLFERGFSRFNAVTQKLFRVVGLVNYLFYDVEQIYIPAKTVRKILCGNGNIKKEDFFMYIKDRYKKIKFKNNDEADAYALAKSYFIDKKFIKE